MQLESSVLETVDQVAVHEKLQTRADVEHTLVT
jgi:hypothetical protein